MRTTMFILALLMMPAFARAQTSGGIVYDNTHQRWVAAPYACVPFHGRITPEQCWLESDGDRAWAAVLERAEDACWNGARGACVIELGQRVYELGRTYHVCAAVTLAGCGGAPNLERCSGLKQAPKQAAIRAHAGGECPRRPGANDGAEGSVFRGFSVLGSASTSTVADGIVLDARLHLVDVSIVDVERDGIAMLDTTAKHNVDGTSIDTVIVQRSGRFGLAASGGVANHVMLTGLRVTSACYRAKKGDRCAGLLDATKTGMRIDTPIIHSAINKDRSAVFPSMIVSGPATILHPYAEFDSLPAELGRDTVRLGGLLRVASTSTTTNLRPAAPLLRSARANGVVFDTRDDSQLRIGPHGTRHGADIGRPPLMPDPKLWPEGSEWKDERPSSTEIGTCIAWKLTRARAWKCIARWEE